MLELKNLSITLSQNARPLAQNLSFTLNQGDKAVIIGEEGNGKSSLLKLIYAPQMIEGYCRHTGEIIKKGTVAYLPQSFPEEHLGHTIAEYFADINIPAHARSLARIGISPDFVNSSQIIKTLSGGEKIKIQLAKILIAEPDILLLDEPTNDLDIETLQWLEGFINASRRPVLFISHDEMLIERTANVIIHMEQLVRKTTAKTTVARSNYTDYIKSRGLAFDRQMQVAKKQRADHKAQMDKWQQIYSRVDSDQSSISRQDPAGGRLLKKKMKSVLSTGRRLARESEDFLDIPQQEESIITKFGSKITLPHGKTVLALDLPALHIGSRQLCGQITLDITGPAHIGIIGRNGTGKSTLLKEIWASLRERSDITAAYMPQNYDEVLNFSQSAIDFLSSDARKDTITQVRTYLGSMKFTHDEMLGEISKLSGGQKAKILFLDMVLRNANVLILDEPTRNFSPLSAPEIRATLRAFGGAIISISHDRKYLAQVCDVIYELAPQGLKIRDDVV